MAYPTGLRIFIDGVDCTYNIFGSTTFNPTSIYNTLRDLDITPYLRNSPTVAQMRDRYNRNKLGSQIHTIEITAEDGNGRAEVRLEVR